MAPYKGSAQTMYFEHTTAGGVRVAGQVDRADRVTIKRPDPAMIGELHRGDDGYRPERFGPPGSRGLQSPEPFRTRTDAARWLVDRHYEEGQP